MIEAFSFGDPEPVLDRRISNYFQTWWNGRYYEPPISLDGLARCWTANTHHQSAIGYKANLLSSLFMPHPMLTRQDFKRLCLDLLIFGMCYVEGRRNLLGKTIRLRPSPALYTRVGRDDQCFMLTQDGGDHEYPPGSIFQVQEPDITQEVYGMPSYVSALQSALLNEAATLFRRKYYLNGAHAGFILYMTDPAGNPEDIDNLRGALKQAKGPGNFRNLFMYSPNGKKDGLQIIPIASVAASDEFFNMKNVTRDDVLAAHRIPPQLLGVVPTNGGGFGSIGPAAEVFVRHEIVPIQRMFDGINDWVGEQVITFADYQPGPPAIPEKK